MTHLRVDIDGKMVLNDKLGGWQHTPPAVLANMIKPGAKAKPWMQAMLIAMVDATVRDVPTNISVTTNPKGWVLNVENGVVA